METEETTKRKARLSARQLEILLSYMESHTELREKKINSLPKSERKRKWSELAEILNEEGRTFCSSVKTPDQWRKSWNDQKNYARSKALRIVSRSQTSNTHQTEALTPVEKRILRLMGFTLSTGKSMGAFLNAPPSVSHMEVPTIEDAFVIEEGSTSIKEEILSDESNTTEETIHPEASPQIELTAGASSLQELVQSVQDTSQPTYVAVNFNQPSNKLETSQPEFVTINLNELNKSQTGQSEFVAVNLNQPNSKLEPSHSGFVPVIFKSTETVEKPEEKPVSSKELSAVLENLKHQNDLLKRIAAANEQIAQACMIIANNTEERTKETSLQTELMRDINQTLKYVLKQKTNGEFL